MSMYILYRTSRPRRCNGYNILNMKRRLAARRSQDPRLPTSDVPEPDVESMRSRGETATKGIACGVGTIRKAISLVTTLIKDVALGTVCGVIFVMFLSFLDYHTVTRFRSGHYLLDFISEPEWMDVIEETADVRFVDLNIYNAMKKEIAFAEKLVAVTGREKYDEGKRQIEADRIELYKLNEEYFAELSKLGVSLKNWCSDCKVGVMDCKSRLEYVVERYSLPDNKVKVNLMMEGKCCTDCSKLNTGN